MESNFQTNAGTLMIALEGNLTGGADAMRFSQLLREALAATGSLDQVTIDADKVEFVNSSGLGMLIAARQAVLERGAQFSIQNPGPQLRSLLAVTKLTEILGVVAS